MSNQNSTPSSQYSWQKEALLASAARIASQHDNPLETFATTIKTLSERYPDFMDTHAKRAYGKYMASFGMQKK